MPSTDRYHGAACKTCRRRGKKCTRELPTCKSCRDREVECEGYALKWAGLASRGFLAGNNDASKITSRNRKQSSKTGEPNGRPRKRNKPRPETENQTLADLEIDAAEISDMNDLPFVWQASDVQQPEVLTHENTCYDDIEIDIEAETSIYFAQTLEEDVIELPFFDSQIALIPTPRGAMNFFEIPSELKFILDYHVRECAAKLCVDNNTPLNPYRQYIYPLALRKPALLYACAATSSMHYGTRQGNPTFSLDALRLRGKALSRLKESMWSGEGAIDEANLATILMLILCDLCMGGHSNFEMYFSFAKCLIDARGALRTPNNFVEQYISWMDIMSSASTSRKPAFSLTDIKTLRNSQTSWDYDVVPCAADVFDILSEVVDLYKNSGIADADIQLDILKTRVLTSPLRTERGMPWFHLTEAYRHAVLLYMDLLFELDTSEDDTAWLVSSIVHHAKATPSYSGWSDQLLWPLFHAGLKITDGRRQAWLREKIAEMQVSGGFSNCSSAMDALELVWSGQFTGRYVDLAVKEGVGDMMVV